MNAAIVGLGWWGQTLVESVHGASDVIKFVAAASRTKSPDNARFAQSRGLLFAESYNAILNHRSIDAVVLATPHTLHAAQVVAAAKAGKHVFCETPLALAGSDAKRAVDATQAAGVTLGLGYNRRFHPEMVKLRERIRGGSLGTILHVEATMTCANVRSLKAGAWRAQKAETPCGGLTPMGVHAIDGMIDFCGEIDTVFCQSVRRAVKVDADDTTSMLFRMKAGMSGYLGTMTTTGPGSSFQVYGSTGWVRLEGMTPVAGALSAERRSRLFGASTFQPAKGPAEVWDAERFDATRAALEAFAVAAGGGPAYPIPPEQMVHGVAVTEAVIRSAATGNVEMVPRFA